MAKEVAVTQLDKREKNRVSNIDFTPHLYKNTTHKIQVSNLNYKFTFIQFLFPLQTIQSADEDDNHITGSARLRVGAEWIPHR